MFDADASPLLSKQARCTGLAKRASGLASGFLPLSKVADASVDTFLDKIQMELC